MYLAFLNPQGNFDPNDSYWTEHPDFGGQLVYVKEVAIAMAGLGHTVDIITRQVLDPDWPEFASTLDSYSGVEGVRIVRIPCGPPSFLAKERLWPHLGEEWTSRILGFYEEEGRLPDAVTTHYADGGLVGALIERRTGIPFTFTGHSLGAQKMDKLQMTPGNLAALDERYQFSKRILAERIAMNRAAKVVVSTRQERFEQYAHPAYRHAVSVEDDDHFAVIPPGVNLRIFDVDARAAREEVIVSHVEAMLRRDLAQNRLNFPLIVSSSRLDAKKNHVGLVRAFAEGAELQRRANLAIFVRGLDNPLRDPHPLVGEERFIMDEIIDIVREHDLWGKITAFPVNSQDELAAAYRHLAARGSVFCLTALYEPFGLAPMEAIAAGLPAVVTENGGPSESLYDATSGEEYGILVDPASPADIARGLLRVVGNAEAWQHFHMAGRARVYEHYTWGSTAKGYEALLSDILQKIEPIPDHFLEAVATDFPLQTLSRLYFGE